MTPEGAVTAALSRHYGGTRPERLGVAVSGGSDSLALLHVLKAWGVPHLSVATVNHGLRVEAGEEAQFVAEVCERLGVPHQIINWDGWDGKGNLQAEARRNRYSLLADWALSEGLERVALGHTMDDQAETFLMRVGRRSGVDGLALMATDFERHGMRFDRPLLFCSRKALKDYLETLGQVWVSDPSNDDTRFDRVKARKALEHLADLGIDAEVLFEVSIHLQEASQALSATAADYAEKKVTSDAGDLVFDRTSLRCLPREIMRRVLASALRWVGSADYPPRRDALAEVEGAIAKGDSATLHGCRILVSAMTIRITREHAAVASLAAPTDAIWDGRWRLEGPHAANLAVRALGEAVSQCPEWRETRLPRATLLASPAVWEGQTLVAAPIARYGKDWSAATGNASDFAAFLAAH